MSTLSPMELKAHKRLRGQALDQFSNLDLAAHTDLLDLLLLTVGANGLVI